MKYGKFYALRPWHFRNGADFSIEDFREYQYRAQRWQNCLWMYVFLLIPLVWLILGFSVILPRSRRMKQAAYRLGIWNEIRDALDRMEAGEKAYPPTQAELDVWSAEELQRKQLNAQKAAVKKSPKSRKKRNMIWGIVLLAICVIFLINGLTGNLEVDEGESVLPPLIICTLLFGGGGLFLLISSFKIKISSAADTNTSGFCENCGAAIPDDAKFCPKCGRAR